MHLSGELFMSEINTDIQHNVQSLILTGLWPFESGMLEMVVSFHPDSVPCPHG